MRSAGLLLRFRCYGGAVSERWPNRLDISLPFFHLATQGFWTPHDAEGRITKSPENCMACRMHPEFFQALSDPVFREQARFALIAAYFEPAERITLRESLGLEVSEEQIHQAEEAVRSAVLLFRRKGRCARFSVRVCSEYRHTCALTGYQCVTANGSSVVDAAHIEAWSVDQNDDPENGLALSKTAHWMFDEGLWSVDDSFRVVINREKFAEQGPEVLSLGSYAGKPLRFHPDSRMRPGLRLLRAHRERMAAG